MVRLSNSKLLLWSTERTGCHIHHIDEDLYTIPTMMFPSMQHVRRILPLMRYTVVRTSISESSLTSVLSMYLGTTS